MQDLLNKVHEMADAKYARATEKFGAANNSPLESYKVILMKFGEAIDAIESFQTHLEIYRGHAKRNEREYAQQQLDYMRKHAEVAAAEWIQVAAMCHKATLERAGNE